MRTRTAAAISVRPCTFSTKLTAALPSTGTPMRGSSQLAASLPDSTDGN